MVSPDLFMAEAINAVIAFAKPLVPAFVESGLLMLSFLSVAFNGDFVYKMHSK